MAASWPCMDAATSWEPVPCVPEAGAVEDASHPLTVSSDLASSCASVLVASRPREQRHLQTKQQVQVKVPAEAAGVGRTSATAAGQPQSTRRLANLPRLQHNRTDYLTIKSLKKIPIRLFSYGAIPY